MLRIIARNIASNWVGITVHSFITFFLTPFILSELGEVRYGIWVLVTGFTGYYGLLGMGIRPALNQYLTRYFAQCDFLRMNQTVSTAFVGFCCIGFLSMCFTGILCYVAPTVFEIPHALVSEARYTIAIIGFSIVVQLAFAIFSAVFVATQRYDLTNGIAITIRLAGAGATVGVLYADGGLVGVTAVNAAAEITGYLIRWRVSYYILPELSVAFRLASIRRLWEMATYGIWAFLSQSASQLIYGTDTIVIGIFMPVAAIAPFALAGNLINRAMVIFVSMATVFFPALTELDAKGDEKRMREIYLAGSKLMMLIAVFCLITSATWAKEFYTLWVGPEYVWSTVYPSVALLFQILMVSTAITSGQRIGHQVLHAKRRVSTLAGLMVCEAIFNFLLSIILIQLWGVTGVAIGTLLPAFLFQGIIHPIVLCRLLKLNAIEYLRKVYLRPIIFSVVFCIIEILAYDSITPIESWSSLIIVGAGSCLIGLILIFIIGLTEWERRKLEGFARRYWSRTPALSR